MSTSVERIQYLMQKNNEIPSRVMLSLELSTNALTEWKKGKAKPSTDAIIKLANYFNVSTDYILLGQDTHSELDPGEKEWLQFYHELSDGDRRECIGYMKGLLSAVQREQLLEKKIVGND